MKPTNGKATEPAISGRRDARYTEFPYPTGETGVCRVAKSKKNIYAMRFRIKNGTLWIPTPIISRRIRGF